MLLLLALGSPVQAQGTLTRVRSSPWSGFDHFTVPRADGSNIDLYLAEIKNKRVPTIVLFGGSKALPVVMLRNDRVASSLLFFEHLNPGDGVNIVVVEKRGLKPFSAAPESREQAKEAERAAFEGGLYRKETRVDDGVAVVKALLGDDRFTDLHLAGHSEGADVVTGIARHLGGQGIRSLGLIAGAGPTRFFEAAQRAREESGAQGALEVFEREIQLTGSSPPQDTAALHESSYSLRSSPLDDVRGLNIPLFVAAGDKDEKVPVAAADLFVSELLRQPSQPIHYCMLPGLDHSFLDPAGRDRSRELWLRYLRWVKEGPGGRKVELGP